MEASDMGRDVLRRAQRGLRAALLPRQRGDGLLDQRGLPLDGGLDDAQVTRLDAVLPEFYRGPEHGKRLGAVGPGAADEPVVLELGEQVLGGAGGGEQL